MDKESAFEFIKKDIPVTHSYFDKNEYVTSKNYGKTYLLSGKHEIKPDMFWFDRKGEQWNEGWEIYIGENFEFLCQNWEIATVDFPIGPENVIISGIKKLIAPNYYEILLNTILPDADEKYIVEHPKIKFIVERVIACVNACAGIPNHILLNPELKRNDLFFQCLDAENKVERFTLENNELIVENEKLYKMLWDFTFHAAKRDNTNDPGNVITFRHDLADSVKKAQDLISETAKNKRTKKYRCNKCNGAFNTPKLIHDNEDYEHCPHCESDDFDLMPKKI